MAHIDYKSFILDFIEFYRGLPALWDTECLEYNNKIVREEQNQQLLEKYQERYPTASKKDVAKKINNLRSNYNRELRRMKENERSSTGVEDNIESGLYYFNAISFINDIETPSTSRSTIQSVSYPSRKRKKPSPNSKFVDKAIQHIDQTKHEKPKRDEADIFAEAWATIYRKLQPDQKMYARHGIDKLLYQGELGNLHLNAVQVVPRTPSKHPLK